MTINIIYVEDDQVERDELEEAIKLLNENNPDWRKIFLTTIDHPSKLEKYLDDNIDLVLADVCYEDQYGNQVNKLEEIIEIVRDWDKKSSRGCPVPIIACTNKGTEKLKFCLEKQDKLFDIWTKMTTFPEYVAWKFQKIEEELPRYRPDATIQKLISEMSSANSPEFHEFVLDMIRKYGEGQNDYERINKSRDPIQSILANINLDEAVDLMKLWDILTLSEPLLRAASYKLRGISRHSINVFWLGYWLINNPILKQRFAKIWKEALNNRNHISQMKDMDPIESLNNIWVLTSLFHDCGKLFEQGSNIIKQISEYYGKLDSLNLGYPTWNIGTNETVCQKLESTFYLLKRRKNKFIGMKIKENLEGISFDKSQPDHGAISAAHLINISGDEYDTYLSEYASEASIAILLHNQLPSLYEKIKNNRKQHMHIDWKSEPIACLLLFCDQIQTWDREDNIRVTKDYPDRAELRYLKVFKPDKKNKLKVEGCIDYIAPARVDMYPELRMDIKESLNRIILEKPRNILSHIIKKGSWPFAVHLDCTLSGKEISTKMDFE